jgi:hypothetical protein
LTDLFSLKHRYDALVTYSECTLEIVRQGELMFKRASRKTAEGSRARVSRKSSSNFASGFEVKLVYSKDLVVDGNAIGLSDDFEYVPTLRPRPL